MGDYRQVRSSSPTNDERHDSDEYELGEQPATKSPVLVDEQKERLLSEDGEEDLQESGDLYDEPRKRRRRKWLRIGLFGLGGIAVIAVLGVLLHRLYLQEVEKKDARTFRRPSSDYIIDPAWDYDAAPTVREYHWVISDLTANPDGVYRPMMVINGQFPGPQIVCNEGDKIVVNVVNQATNATSIHWHGLFQNGSNWNDGAAGITQCPIAPGQSYQYEFTVNGQAGSCKCFYYYIWISLFSPLFFPEKNAYTLPDFYHGHQSAQTVDGLFGPLIILSKAEKENQPIPYDTDRVIMVQDWYHDTSYGLLRQTLSPGSESSPTPNGALINGANRIDCSLHPNRHCDSSTALLPTFDLAPGLNHRLRVMNVGAFAWFEVSVDRHLHLPVTEVDGVTVEPVSDSAVLISPGQRYSVVLTANQTDPSNLYWFRARMVNHCFAENILPDKGVAAAQAIIRYDSSPPTTGSGTSSSSSSSSSRISPPPATIYPQTEADSGKFTVTCKDPNPLSYRPRPARAAPAYAHHSWYMRVNLEIGNWRLERGFLNKSTLRPQLQSPSLHRLVEGLQAGNESFAIEGVNDVAFDKKHELTVSSRGIEVVDIILQNFDEGNHPFHLHGTQMFILAAGHGYFPGYEALGLNAEGRGLLNASDDSIVANPLRRDVTAVESFGWTLIRFVADNPGVWLFHCHMIWHGEAGMGMQFAARTDVMRNWTVPEQNARLCAAPVEELEKGATPKDSIWYGHFVSDIT